MSVLIDGMKMPTRDISTTRDISAIGTNCQICDAFIPIVSARYSYPGICEECKKRLKELLYPKEE